MNAVDPQGGAPMIIVKSYARSLSEVIREHPDGLAPAVCLRYAKQLIDTIARLHTTVGAPSPL
jgi:hypothetical protein